MPSPIPPFMLLPSSNYRCSTAKCDRAASYSLSGKFLCDECEAARIRRDLRITAVLSLAAVALVLLACIVLAST